jgi:nucleoside 2-deoxyribosyltransferase
MKRVVICGSMSFIDEMIATKKEYETTWNNLIITIPDVSENSLSYESKSWDEKVEMKKQFILTYRSHIENADLVLIWNKNKNNIEGYIGTNTLMEMSFAYAYNKPIYLIQSPNDKNTKLEILGMEPQLLKKNFAEILNKL